MTKKPFAGVPFCAVEFASDTELPADTKNHLSSASRGFFAHF